MSTRFVIGLLVISLICPPLTAASIAMVCAMPEMNLPMGEHPMDETRDADHSCCTMPEVGQDCEIPALAFTTCCDDIPVTHHQDVTRTLPVSRYDTSLTALATMAFSSGLPVVLTAPPQYRDTSVFYPDVSPPLRTLLCTYLI